MIRRVHYTALIVDYAGVFTDKGIPNIVAAARTRGFKTALLSNADRVPPGLPDVFDAVVVSGEAGVAKPDPEIFRITAARLGTPVRQCVFVDDVAGYVRGAAQAGMTGVHHRDLDSTVDELTTLLGVDLR
ncbi:HAD-IA family hydrolase [Actinokineospora sp. NBRC 105648]|uniref:HAD-IA family hydrolase n=1 Tax=Actinokineospora sp. NBRC 105648 TaxID=3032206 RepID=UPI0024A59BFD|nr:HAD-IA family hydrolase [Actinokineospora sp. NBRC 105648]GLZ38468.1 haloacid dehalogenase [Actinokineospora sp. NBRC 105648]